FDFLPFHLRLPVLFSARAVFSIITLAIYILIILLYYWILKSYIFAKANLQIVRPFFSRYDNNPVVCITSVKGSSISTFQNVNGFNIICIQPINVSLDGHAIYDIKRLAASAD